jgi:AcrR family transcriptional regulator
VPRTGLTPERLTVAGAELADEVGLELVTLSALARRFDVRAPSLYSHVASTEDLRTRVALLALDELADRVADQLAGRAGRDALAAFAAGYRDYAREHPGRYDATRLPLDDATARRSAGPRHAEMTRAVLRGYDLHGDDQTHAVRLLGSVVHGWIALETAGGFSHSAPDADTSWQRVLDALDSLLRHWPDPTTETSR